MNKKSATVFLSSSAGELEWVLPIVEYLLDNNFDIKIVYRTNTVKKSIESNAFLKKYIYKHSGIECYKLNWLGQKVNILGVYLYIFKSNLSGVKLLDYCFDMLDKALGFIFIKCIPKNIVRRVMSGKSLVFLEWPGLKFSSRHRYWIEKSFSNSIFFYFPHSTSTFSSKSWRNYSNSQNEFFQSRSYAMTGYPGDFEAIKILGFDVSGVAPAYIGHPRYSRKWLHHFREDFFMLNTDSQSNVVKILVISANFSYHLITNELDTWIASIEKVIQKYFLNYQIMVKLHPREVKSRWDEIIKKSSSIVLTEESVLEAAHKVNFSITFLSSSTMDCFLSGTPVIEFINTEQIPIENRFGNTKHTDSKEFGIVLSASNENELENAINKVTNQNYRISLDSTHPLFQESIQRSNNWESHFEKILNANNIYL